MNLNKIVYGVGTLMELVGVGVLASIALKRNKDCYDAEMRCIDLEFQTTLAELDKINKDIEIAGLQAEIEKLKKES